MEDINHLYPYRKLISEKVSLEIYLQRFNERQTNQDQERRKKLLENYQEQYDTIKEQMESELGRLSVIIAELQGGYPTKVSKRMKRLEEVIAKLEARKKAIQDMKLPDIVEEKEDEEEEEGRTQIVETKIGPRVNTYSLP